MAKIPPKFVGLQHIAIKVHDIELARRFYTEILGFTITENYKPGEIPDFPFGLCFMRCTELHHDVNLVYWPKGEVNSEEQRSFDSIQVGVHHFALQVENRNVLEEWKSHLESNEIEIFYGPAIHSPTHPEGDGLWGENHALYISDPSGNSIEIFCDMAPMDPYTNRVNEKWFRDRLSRDGHNPIDYDPPQAGKID
tara:strand:- start:12044 stop:12628 length:585 start_codon:yes stop_codon:yes gene_type:complete